MSEFDRLKAQKDAIVARGREAIEAPLKARIAELERTCDGLRDKLFTAISALRSYQYGNASPDLAEEVADVCASALAALPVTKGKP
jgi:hypothetical protein